MARPSILAYKPIGSRVSASREQSAPARVDPGTDWPSGADSGDIADPARADHASDGQRYIRDDAGAPGAVGGGSGEGEAARPGGSSLAAGHNGHGSGDDHAADTSAAGDSSTGASDLPPARIVDDGLTAQQRAVKRRRAGIPARPRGWNLKQGERDELGRRRAVTVEEADRIADPHAPPKRRRKPRSEVPFEISDQDRLRLELRSRQRAIRKVDGKANDDLPTLPGVNALSMATRYIDGGRDTFIELVQLAVLDNQPAAVNWYAVYRDLTAYQRSIVSYDDVCAAAGVKPSQLMAAVVSCAMDLGRDVGNMVAALTHPEVVKQLAASAKRIDGDYAEIAHKDRTAFLQAQGYMPVPKSHVINVNASASAQAAAAAAQEPSVPAFAGDIGHARVVGAGSTLHALPAADANLDPFTQLLQQPDVAGAAEPQAVELIAPDADADV